VTAIRYHPTGMTASLTVEVAVVRSPHSRKCSACGRKRVLFALTFTDRPVGNPESPWKCAPCWGLREEGPRRASAPRAEDE